MSQVKLLSTLIITTILLFAATSTVKGHDAAHGIDNPRGLSEVLWTKENIARVITAGYPDTFGIFAFTRRQWVQYNTIKDKSCVTANFLAFDISDQFAFNINETLEVSVLVDTNATPSLVYGFDQNGKADANDRFKLSPNTGLKWVNATLTKVRFANRGLGRSDFALTTVETMQPQSTLSKDQKTTFTICDIKFTRKALSQTKPSTKTAIKQPEKTVSISFIDGQTGQTTAARVGIYDSLGNLIQVGEDAVEVNYYERKVRHLNLRAAIAPYQFWPHNNRYYFYTDGNYRATLSPGTYTIIATKGPEYRIASKHFIVGPGNSNVEVRLNRWTNMTKKGWYSGDVHIHMQRGEQDNRRFHRLFNAEDLHVANLLAMSNAAKDHFPQYAWGVDGTDVDGNHAIVPGVEAPRTAQRGHALALNVEAPLKQKDNYFLYHQHLKHYQQQKAITGYAHVGSEEFYASRGLALDVPFGLVDFVEIMQHNRMRPQLWYELLNLGFKLAPAAGSDFPYFDQPGAVRSYVKTGSQFDYLRWFEGLKAGKTFISNAPILDLSVAGHLPGASIKLKGQALSISIKAAVNPDYDRLKSIELVYCGEVVKSLNPGGISRASYKFDFIAPGSGWLALRAYGHDFALAHTGAIYLQDDNQQSICQHKADQEINKMLTRLDKLSTSTINAGKELEYWETRDIENQYRQQLPALQQRINQAKAFYQQMQQVR